MGQATPAAGGAFALLIDPSLDSLQTRGLDQMRKTTIALALLATIAVGGGAWYASLDKETRGVLAAMPTNADVLGWSIPQRDAAFRAMDRLPVLAKASEIAPSATPLPLPAGHAARHSRHR